MNLNGVMAVILRYFLNFDKPAFQHIAVSIILWRILCTSLLYWCVYDIVRKEVHVRYLILLMSFLSFISIRLELSELLKVIKN